MRCRKSANDTSTNFISTCDTHVPVINSIKFEYQRTLDYKYKFRRERSIFKIFQLVLKLKNTKMAYRCLTIVFWPSILLTLYKFTNAAAPVIIIIVIKSQQVGSSKTNNSFRMGAISLCLSNFSTYNRDRLRTFALIFSYICVERMAPKNFAYGTTKKACFVFGPMK